MSTHQRERAGWAKEVRRLVDLAPPLTPEQCDRLAALINIVASPSPVGTDQRHDPGPRARSDAGRRVSVIEP